MIRPSENVRVLAVHRYYWPDTPPYASILREIVEQWSADGFDVEVLSTLPSYKTYSAKSQAARREVVDGVLVRRLDLPKERGRRWLAPLNIAAFTARVASRVLLSRRRYDVVMTSTAPPVVLAWLVSHAARLRGGKFIYHCMDIHPEIGRVSGEFRSPLVFRVLQGLDRVTCSTAAAVVVLSNDMASTLRHRRPSQTLPIHEINNFELGERGAASTVQRVQDDDTIDIVFTGNIGRFQGLDTVISALSKVQRANVHLTLMGEGAALDDLRRQAAATPSARVTFLPHQGVASARDLISSADLGLVCLTGGIYRFAYPSKTMTYLAEGCPVLAIVEPDCDLVKMLDREGLGLAVAPANAELLAQKLDWLADQPQSLKRMASQARLTGPSVFDKAETLRKWSNLLDTVVSGVRAA